MYTYYTYIAKLKKQNVEPEKSTIIIVEHYNRPLNIMSTSTNISQWNPFMFKMDRTSWWSGVISNVQDSLSLKNTINIVK